LKIVHKGRAFHLRRLVPAETGGDSGHIYRDAGGPEKVRVFLEIFEIPAQRRREPSAKPMKQRGFDFHLTSDI
jgi:hypothetical protein